MTARLLRDVALIAWFDLRESLRSRKALALLVMYLVGAMAAAGMFVSLLAELERALARQLAVAQTARPGAMTGRLMESEEFRSVLAGLIGDPALAAQLVAIPPMALFYGWLALTFLPLLVTFTSADSVTSELASGSCRFVLFRTERLAWAAGKLGGQAAMMAVGVLAGAAGVWIVGLAALRGFDAAASAWWLLRLSGRAWIYGVPFLGMALGISQATRSVGAARALALGGLIALGVGGLAAGAEPVREKAPVLVGSAQQLFPNAHRLDLWRPAARDRAPAAAMLGALGIVYFALGYARMSRRDA